MLDHRSRIRVLVIESRFLGLVFPSLWAEGVLGRSRSGLPGSLLCGLVGLLGFLGPFWTAAVDLGSE